MLISSYLRTHGSQRQEQASRRGQDVPQLAVQQRDLRQNSESERLLLGYAGSRRTGRVLHRRSELAEYGPRHLLRQYGPVPSPTWIALGNAAQEYTFKGDADKSIDKFITAYNKTKSS
ncbi:hypothetical protein D3H35_26120 [Cohnella faecalis]|uniref:Uncharacterized protein n=1 Tax=Cohnella faecalis TaxID=2315694 RepID=A0A398CG07_9BACL|nr:hypothetical protein D3H35_26120 [Cohnella faecalis]